MDYSGDDQNDIYENEDLDSNISDIDNDEDEYDEDENDYLLNDGIDNSGKIINIEPDDDLIEDDIKLEDGEEDNEEPDKPVMFKGKRKYKIFPFAKINEYTVLIGRLTQYIEESKVNIPEEYYELLRTSTGNSQIIATEWVHHHKKFPLPFSIIRSVQGIEQIIKPENLIFDHELNMYPEYSVSDSDFYNNFRTAT